MESDDDSFATPMKAKPERSESQKKFGETTLSVGSPFNLDKSLSEIDANMAKSKSANRKAKPAASPEPMRSEAATKKSKRSKKKGKVVVNESNENSTPTASASATSTAPATSSSSSSSSSKAKSDRSQASSKATPSPRVGYKKKLIRLFSNAGDLQAANQPAPEPVSSVRAAF